MGKNAPGLRSGGVGGGTRESGERLAGETSSPCCVVMIVAITNSRELTAPGGGALSCYPA